jgi:archaellum biogenesis ATPase FlaH
LRSERRHTISAACSSAPWAIEPILAKGHLTGLAGPEGEGKSLLSLALGCCLAGGEPVAGFAAAEKGRVLVIDAENGVGEIHRRVRALGLTDRASDSITFFAAEALDLRRDLEMLAALVDTERPDLLVLDSFRSLWGGDENTSDQVAPVLDGLRNLGRSRNVAILLLHHTTKDRRTYRGSSAIGASVELMFVLGRAEGDSDPARRFLRCRKSRPAPEPPVHWIRLSAELGSITIDDAEPPDNVPAEARPVRNDVTRQVLAVVRDGQARKRADIGRAVNRDSKDRTVGRVLDELVSAGRIVRSTDGTYRCEQSGKVASPRSAPPRHSPRPKNRRHVSSRRRRLHLRTMLKSGLRLTPRRRQHTVAWAVEGHSEYDDRAWHLLSPLRYGLQNIRSVWPYNHIDHLGLLVLSGATIRPFKYDGENCVGFEVIVVDHAEFLNTLRSTIRTFLQCS